MYSICWLFVSCFSLFVHGYIYCVIIELYNYLTTCISHIFFLHKHKYGFASYWFYHQQVVGVLQEIQFLWYPCGLSAPIWSSPFPKGPLDPAAFRSLYMRTRAWWSQPPFPGGNILQTKLGGFFFSFMNWHTRRNLAQAIFSAQKCCSLSFSSFFSQ